MKKGYLSEYPPYELEEIAFSKLGMKKDFVRAAQVLLAKRDDAGLSKKDEAVVDKLRSVYHKYAKVAALFRLEEILEKYAEDGKTYHLDSGLLKSLNRFITQDIDGSRDLYRDNSTRLDVNPDDSLKGKLKSFVDKKFRDTGVKGIQKVFDKVEEATSLTVGKFNKVIADLRYSNYDIKSDGIRNRNIGNLKTSFVSASLEIMKEVNKRQPFKNGNLETSVAFVRFLGAACHMQPTKAIDLDDLTVAVQQQAVGNDEPLRKIMQNSYSFSEYKLEAALSDRGNDAVGAVRPVDYEKMMDGLNLEVEGGDPDTAKLANPAIDYSDAENVLSKEAQIVYGKLVQQSPEFEENLLKRRRRTKGGD